MTPSFEVVIPVYKNRETLIPLAEQLDAVFQEMGATYCLIFVEDACPDHSTDVLSGTVDDKPIRVIKLKERGGQQRAIFQGLQEVTSPYVVVMDADLQDPPAAIPKLYEVLQSGEYDAVFAGRTGQYQARSRHITSYLFKWTVHKLTNVPIDAGGYVLMTQRMVEQLLAYEAENPYMVGMIGCANLPVTSIPVPRSKREIGESSYSAAMRFKMGASAIYHIITQWKFS